MDLGDGGEEASAGNSPTPSRNPARMLRKILSVPFILFKVLMMFSRSDCFAKRAPNTAPRACLRLGAFLFLGLRVLDSGLGAATIEDSPTNSPSPNFTRDI